MELLFATLTEIQTSLAVHALSIQERSVVLSWEIAALNQNCWWIFFRTRFLEHDSNNISSCRLFYYFLTLWRTLWAFLQLPFFHDATIVVDDAPAPLPRAYAAITTTEDELAHAVSSLSIMQFLKLFTDLSKNEHLMAKTSQGSKRYFSLFLTSIAWRSFLHSPNQRVMLRKKSFIQTNKVCRHTLIRFI